MKLDPALLAWLLLPLVAGLQRFSVSYGYGGEDRNICRRNAWRLVAFLYVVEALVLWRW